MPDLQDDARPVASAVADRIRAFIRARIAAGDMKTEIKEGSSTSSASRCSPRRQAGVQPPRVGAAAVSSCFAVGSFCARGALEPPTDRTPRPLRRRPTRARPPGGRGARPPRRLAAARQRPLRVPGGARVGPDALRAAARPRLPVRRLRRRGTASASRDRTARARVERPVRPRVHRRVRRARGRRGRARRRPTGARRTEVAGLLLVVFGLAFLGLLPVPERALAPELLARARRGSAFLGAAFAVCAAPCVGAILGLRSRSRAARTVVRGRRSPSCTCSDSARLPPRRRRLRAGDGGVPLGARPLPRRAVGERRLLVALGLMLFFDRDYWLRVTANRVLEFVRRSTHLELDGIELERPGGD